MARPRSLWPKEHGAYAQLLVPLLTGFAAARPSAAATAWAVAACLGFLAHEPALVLLGRRGARAKTEAGARAGRHLVGLGAGALLGAAVALYLDPSIAGSVAVIGGLVALAALFVWRGGERSALGEVVAAVALSSTVLPVLTAGGLPVQQSLLHCAAWGLGFAAATGGVRGVIAAHRGRPEPLAWPLIVVGLLVAGLGGIRAPELWAALPLAASGLALILIRPSAKHLRGIGVALVVAAVASGAGLVTIGRL